MPLELYKPATYDGSPTVTMSPPGAFKFSARAAKEVDMNEKRWVRIRVDHEDRLVVFEFLGGLDRPDDSLKLQRSKKGYRSVTAKGLVRNTRESYWIERHKDRNEGQLPAFNRVGGRKRLVGAAKDD